MRALVLACLSFLLATPLWAQDVTVQVTWTNPTTRLNGSPLTNAAGTKIYGGPSPDAYTLLATVNDSTQTSATLTIPLAPTTTFIATTYDADGKESAPSQGATLVVDLPNPPTGVNCTGEFVIVAGVATITALQCQ